ncbi:ATPase, T2SS/T4P/T4SS family [Desulforamulus ruminis]|uniref:ATPase, T2SS/T4P/T4SS family n=1 Tax=Desulforamulus ruminis TaxID=1564 RepID=UPI002FDB119E
MSGLTFSSTDFRKQIEADREAMIHNVSQYLQEIKPEIFEDGLNPNSWSVTHALIRESILSKYQLVPDEVDQVIKGVISKGSGWGPLTEFVVGRPDADQITEVQVVPQGKNPPNVFYCKNGRPVYAGNHYFENSHAAVENFCRKIIEGVDRELIKNAPIVDAWMKDMSRLAVAAFDVCPQGLSFSIRKSPLTLPPIPMGKMVQNGTLPRILMDMCQDLFVHGGASWCINGRTDSGKTALLKAILTYIKDIDKIQRVLIGETSFEMFLSELPNCYNMVETVVGGKKVVTMKDICQSANRNNPDWFVLSEIRGEEIGAAATIAESLSGKFASTFHAGGVREFQNKIFKLLPQGGINLPMQYVDSQIQSMYNFLLFQDKDSLDKRTFMSLVEITEDGYEEILVFDEDEYLASNGKVRRWIYNKPISKKRLAKLAFRGARNIDAYTEVKEKYHYAEASEEVPA